jgi:glycosyltransferase involved in cell wall biosynthesis
MKILIVIPIFNEERIISANLKKLADYLRINFSANDYKIVVADNHSTDLSAQKIKELLPEIKYLAYEYYEQKGKGLAIMKTWQKYQAEYEIFVFMDADLATDLSALSPLVEAIKNGADLAIGSRYLPSSQIKRSWLRKLFSLGYRIIFKLVLNSKISDFPCGFKAVSQKVVAQLVPLVQNQSWFSDSELIYLAEKKNFSIKEIPINWAEPRQADDKSKVNPLKVSGLYLKELVKLKFRKI